MGEENFIMEIENLKMVKRSGWWAAWVKEPETVAEHSFATSIMAWIIAKKENADIEKCVKMALLHDVPETRILDLHKLSQMYSKVDEKKVVREQAKMTVIGKEFEKLMKEFREGKTKEAIVVKDADHLECAVQAKIYEKRYPETNEWIERVGKALKTKTAKEIFEKIKNKKNLKWWELINI